jgi:hypothetical protein
MKIILLLAYILGLSFSSSFIDNFDDDVNQAYSEYQIYDEYSNSQYAIKTVYGLVNGEVRYGVCFFSMQAQDYYLVVEYQEETYYLPKNSRGDINAVAISFKTGETFTLRVFNQDGHLQPSSHFINIEVISKINFENLSNNIAGLNQGIKTTKLQLTDAMSALAIFYFSMIGVFGVCVLVIIIFYWRKKGFFDPEALHDIKEPLFKIIQEDIESVIEQETESTPRSISDFDLLASTQKHTFENSHYGRDEEEYSGFDIQEHLRNLGFILDYSLQDETSKNNITIELIKLRNQKQITQDDYLEEMAKLWKK